MTMFNCTKSMAILGLIQLAARGLGAMTLHGDPWGTGSIFWGAIPGLVELVSMGLAIDHLIATRWRRAGATASPSSTGECRDFILAAPSQGPLLDEDPFSRTCTSS